MTLEVWGDGSISPEDAFGVAANVLKEQVWIFIYFDENIEPELPEIETEDEFSKSDGSWTGLLAIFIILSFCSYIIFTGMEDQVSESVESEDEEVSQDEDKREMAITNESSEDE